MWQNDLDLPCRNSGTPPPAWDPSSMRLPVLFAAALAALPACATDVTLIGIFPGKAVITVNRGVPRTISTGERTAEGVLLISTGHDQAVLEIDGVKQTLD